MADRPRIAVDPIILGYAVRYAIGRQTWAVEDICSSVVEHADWIPAAQRPALLHDLRHGHEQTDARFASHWRRAIDALEEVTVRA